MVGSSINLSDLQSGSFTGYVGSQGVIGYTGSKGEFGGAAFEYNYSNTTSAADPGAGNLRFNALDLSTANTLYIDFVDLASANSYNYLQVIDDSTSGVKGTFKIEDKANTQNFAFFSITGSHTNPGDYFQVPVAWINGVTSFTNGLDTVTTFVRTGDKGDIGYTGSSGYTGSKGTDGTIGYNGSVGYTGSQGYSGSQGYTGSAAYNNYMPAITGLNVTHSGASAYLFDQYGATNNPTIYALSGSTIAFNLAVTGHPFLIRTSGGANTSTGLTHVATDGTVSTDSSAQGKVTGTLYWKIPQSISGNYQYICSVHGGMVGVIAIQDFDPGSNTQVIYNDSGILVGNASLTFVSSSNTLNVNGAVNATSHSVGTSFTANATLVNAAAVNVTGQVNTATFYAATSANVGSAVIANATGIYTTGVANAVTLSAGANFTANTTLANTAAINVVGQTNTATLYVTTSANVGSAVVANASGIYTSGVVNAASHSVGTTFTANATLVNAAAVNVTGQVNTATFYAATSANVGTVFTANTTALAAAANLAMSNNYIVAPALKAYSEFVTTNAASTGATTLDLSSSNFFNLTLTGSVTFTFSNPPSGRAFTFTIVAKQDATGGRAITWPAGSKYAGAVTPPATTTANAVDIWSVMTYDAGSTYIVSLAVKNAS